MPNGPSHLEVVVPKFVLEWVETDHGVMVARKVLVNDRTSRRMTKLHTTFATVRPQFNADGLYANGVGYVVTRGTFEDLRSFDSASDAKVYVESLFALEEL